MSRSAVRFRFLTGVLASTLVLLSQPANSTIRAASPDSTDESAVGLAATTALKEAQSLRADLGLASDQPTVLESLTSPMYAVGPFGIPTTPAEDAVVEATMARQRALLPVAESAALDPFFAGAYFQADRLTIATTSRERTLEALAGLLSADLSIDLVAVRTTAKTLNETRDQIVADAPTTAGLGFALKSVSVDPRRNKVVVGVSSGVDRAMGHYLGRYDEGTVLVQYEALGDGSLLVCTEDDCGTKGGLKIKHTTTIGASTCTSGFLVKRDGTATRAILTAGHCLAPLGGINSTVPWKNGAGTTTWGLSLNFQYNPPPLFIDQGVIGLGGVVPSAWNQYYTGSPVVSSITGELTWTQQVAGITLCRYGITSNWGCGTLTRPDLHITLSDGTVLTHTFEVRHKSAKGDSGAGYIYYTQYGTYSAVGILSSGDNRSGVDYSYYWPTVYSINGPAGLWITSPCTSSIC